ncbi:hypothetical protein AAY473_034370, partial [Plecturocebus cupreus]
MLSRLVLYSGPQGLNLLRWLECSGMITAQSSLDFPGLEMRFCHVSQAGLEHLCSSAPHTLASQSAGITGVNNCPEPLIFQM